MKRQITMAKNFSYKLRNAIFHPRGCMGIGQRRRA